MNTSSVTNFNSAFYSTTAFNQNITGWSSQSVSINATGETRFEFDAVNNMFRGAAAFKTK